MYPSLYTLYRSQIGSKIVVHKTFEDNFNHSIVIIIIIINIVVNICKKSFNV